MEELFYDGLGNTHVKPKDKEIRNRFSVYALVYIKDVDRYLFINPIPETRDDFFKLVGGGIEDGENHLEALNREFIEEIGYSLNNYFIKKDYIEYVISFKPLRKTDEYWYNNQSIYYFEIDKFADSGFPSVDKWVCDTENIPSHLLSKKYIEENLDNFHFTIKEALKKFL